MKKSQIPVVLIILFLLGVFGRLGPHPMNFTPVFAIALFAGAYLPKKWSIILPLLLMLFTDLFLGFYELGVMVTVYGSIALTGALGLALRKRKSLITVASAALGVSLFFFLTTNFAVWAFSPWYASTWEGLLLSYTLAVPFFRNTLLGNVFFVGILFGSYELVRLKLNQTFKYQALKSRSR
ncbi:MAG TPA: DUF6580 family putative transport protein [Patescibacteria group bacterium]|nr:DUF6580 family putative transport protein [Patescibacteria group bacterium]